jgi:hypothetical protein
MPKAWPDALPPSLMAAIDDLYAAFASYPWRATMPACPHCLQTYPGFPEPLPEIPAERLHYYLFKAMTTIGEAVDFKHYLPRLLDAWAQEYVGGKSILYHEVLGEKIARADFDTWPESEQDAVRRFFAEVWSLLLACYPIYPDAEVVLCAVGQFTSIQPFLDVWRETLTVPALAYLVELTVNQPINAFWDSTPRGQHEQDCLIRWLYEAPTADMLAIARQEAERGNFDTICQESGFDFKYHLLGG